MVLNKTKKTKPNLYLPLSHHFWRYILHLFFRGFLSHFYSHLPHFMTSQESKVVQIGLRQQKRFNKSIWIIYSPLSYLSLSYSYLILLLIRYHLTLKIGILMATFSPLLSLMLADNLENLGCPMKVACCTEILSLLKT